MYNRNPSIANPDSKIIGTQYNPDTEAIYGNHIRNTTAMCNTSASHTYGNVISVIEKYLLEEIFPKGLFENGTVLTSTTLASRQIHHLPHQMLKKEFPMMILVPRISFGQGDDRFLSNTIMNSRYTNTQSFWGEGNLLPLAEDPRKHLWIHGHYNRAVMYIDVILSFNTYSEQMNYVSHLWNMAPINHNKFISAPLELYIPEQFCNLIAHLAKVPIRDKNDSVYEFLTYMNSIWSYPITYKLNGGSQTDDFFMYYIADIDVQFQEPTYDSGIKDGQIHRAYSVSFTIRCDFNTIGYFTLNSPDIKKQIHIQPTKDDINHAILPIFSDVINLNDFDLPIGWNILSWPIFKLKPDTNSISIDPILNNSLKTVIDYHLKVGLPMDKFIKIQFRENGDIVNNELFYIDWAKRELILLKPNPRKTYRLIVMASIEYVNNLIKELYNLE
jgi:hypothetical protein